MEIRDIAKEQLDSASQQQVLEKYRNCFEKIRGFGPEDKNYLQATRERVEELDGNLAQKEKTRLREITEEKVNRMRRKIDTEKDPGLIIFIGNGIPDGHAILLGGNPWVVIDLKTFVDRSDFYNQEVYLTHEIAHAFHYPTAPSFYFGNNQGVLQPPIFKMMITEGIATYCSSLFTSATMHDAYWFGQYTKEEVKEWMNLCEQEKSAIHDKTDMCKNKVEPELLDQLFDVPKRALGKSRMGYYYGTKTVQKVVKEKELQTTLNMELQEYKHYVFHYSGL